MAITSPAGRGDEARHGTRNSSRGLFAAVSKQQKKKRTSRDNQEAKHMTMFQKGFGDWKQYRSRFNLSKSDETDLHRGKRDRSILSFDEAMAEVSSIVERGLKEAQREGRPYVMFIHGKSTSRRGKTTARSQVRNFMRSKAATSLVERGQCIQHETVFVAKVRRRYADDRLDDDR